ncbi:hypothetical protein BRM87_24590 [Xanthomonas oryzae pv. oryzae]|nr:hypothetical protein BRL73_18585 [Xanthomonas oryzae pv. oryzae]RBF31117.1 hypothetical protein BRM87_24590 [Xanthomonas oryzae pv. oryzae]RBG65954.1 hypothetical protein BRM51_05760 [Xanthomonas oryzae pv. oryzae]
MPPHSEQIVSRICGALFRGSLAVSAVVLLAALRWRRTDDGNAPVLCVRSLPVFSRGPARALRSIRTSWYLAVFSHADTPSCRRAVACR